MSNSKAKEFGVDKKHDVLLDRIKSMLQNSDPMRWKKGGHPLNPEMRFEKPRDYWEVIYSIEIPSGVLVIRCSLAVRSEFVGRGFSLIPTQKPRFLVELRAKGWHHSELTDPHKRSRISDRTHKVMAENKIAYDIFIYVSNYLENFHQESQKKFNESANEVALKLFKECTNGNSDIWYKVDDEENALHFQAEFLDLTVDVYKGFTAEGLERYGLFVSDEDRYSEIKDQSLVKDLFALAEEQGKTSSLVSLSKALEEI